MISCKLKPITFYLDTICKALTHVDESHKDALTLQKQVTILIENVWKTIFPNSAPLIIPWGY